MMKIIAKIVSYLFHPLLIVTWMTVLLYITNQPQFADVQQRFGKISPILPVFLYTFLFPVIAILMMKKLGFLESLEMPDSKQRIIPFIICIVLYIWTYLMMRKTGYPMFLRLFMLGSISTLMLAFVINVFHKLSLHMAAITGATLTVFLWIFYSQSDLAYFFIFMIILSGLVATSRLLLQAHTGREVYSGFLTGVFGQFIALMLIDKLIR